MASDLRHLLAHAAVDLTSVQAATEALLKRYRDALEGAGAPLAERVALIREEGDALANLSHVSMMLRLGQCECVGADEAVEQGGNVLPFRSPALVRKPTGAA